MAEIMLDWFLRVTVTKCHKLGVLSQQKFIVSVWETGSLNHSVSRVMRSDGFRKEYFLASSVWCLPAILDVPCLIDASLQSYGCLLPLCLHTVLPLGMSVSLSNIPLL